MSNLKIFLDTNILFTLLKKEEEFYNSCSELRNYDYDYCISTLTLQQIQGFLCYRKKSVSDYIKNKKVLIALMEEFNILTTTDEMIKTALENGIMTDIEDNIQLITAVYYGCNVIITNDKRFIAINDDVKQLAICSSDNFIKNEIANI